MKQRLKVLLVLSIAALVLLAAGCGGAGVQRISGLSADGVVKTFFDSAKAGRLNEAGLYVAPGTANDPGTVLKYLTGREGLDQLKNANLLSLKKVAEEGNYSVVVATMQTQENSLGLVVKPVGLEKINGEWYIVDFDKIYQDAKYKLLQQLISNI